MNFDRKRLDQLSGQMEQMIKLKIYNLLIKSLEGEQVSNKLRDLMNVAEVFQPGTKNMVKKMIHQDLMHQKKSTPSKKRGKANNGLL